MKIQRRIIGRAEEIMFCLLDNVFFLITVLVGVVLIAINAGAEITPTPRLSDVGLKELNKYRPAISVHYYPGHPGWYSYGQTSGQNSGTDNHRLAAYFDAVGCDVGGMWKIGPPNDTKKSSEIIFEEYKGFTGFGGWGLGLFAHLQPGAPGWFLEQANWYGKSKDFIWADPKYMFLIADPQFYKLVINRWAEEIIGSIPKEKQPDLWWLESEPGENYISYDRLRAIDCPLMLPLWQKFLSRELGDVETLNQAAGTDFKDLNEISLKNDNWLVRIMVARFASWVLYSHYQGQEATAFRKYSKGVPVATRWCEMSAYGLDPRDFSRFDEVDVDYPGFTWYAGNPFIPYCGKNRLLLGKASSNFSMIKFYGKPISSGELGYWRGRTEDANDVNHDYGALRPFQPWELENLMYRCLYYNVGVHNLFNWTFPNDNISWSTHAHYPDLLRSVRQVINEWDRIQPYATFGKALPNEVGIIISRNARLFPITGVMNQDDHYYGDVWLAAAAIMEDPKLSYFDIMEEHAPLVKPDTVNKYKGIIVYDACLSDTTRKIVDDFAKSGKPVLVVGAPKYVNGVYLPAVIPQNYPITFPVDKEMIDLLDENAVDGNLHISGKHLLLDGMNEPAVLALTEVKPTSGASVLADFNGKPIFVVKDNVAYLSAIPYDIKVRRQLYANFLKWCNARVYDLYVSRFDKAVIVQNYKSEHIRTWSDGEILEQFPQIVPQLTMDGPASGQLYESKGDFPWLAFHDGPEGRKIEGIHMDTCQIRVFQNLDGPVWPHFENVSEGLGFTQFMLGTLRLRGYFKVLRPGTYTLSFKTEMWGDRKVHWQLTQDKPLSLDVFAKGDGNEIKFVVTTAEDTLYRIEVTSQKNK